MEFRFKKVRGDLDELGYYQGLSLESVPLTEKLVADLKTTTESLQKYMKLAHRAVEERDRLQLGAEPYKCDNARLVKECNELHQAFLHYKEQNDKTQKELKSQLEIAKSENFDCNSQKEKLKHRIRQLEADLIKQGDTVLNSRHNIKPTLKSASSSALTNKESKKVRTFELSTAMALADEKIASLCKDLKRYKDNNLELIEANELLRCQLTNRDQEIIRLTALLEGGRPLNAIKKDCVCLCGKDSNERINLLHGEIEKIALEKYNLETRLKESLAKQHEAMKRALHLAERNKLLEKEMKDIDNLALAVEAECNNTVKSNAEKVVRLQDRMQNTVIQIQNLERDNAKLKQEKQELNADLDAVILEKKHLQAVLESSLDEKKRLVDRINNFTIIEHDLNMEIDRLTRLTAEQKRKIAELENSLVSEKIDHAGAGDPRLRPIIIRNDSRTNHGSIQHQTYGEPDQDLGTYTVIQTDISSTLPSTQQPQNVKPVKKPPQQLRRNSKSVSAQPSGENHTKTARDCVCGCCKGCSDVCGSAKHLKDLLDKEIDYREQQALHCIENLRSEKDYYMREYHKLLEQLKNIPSRQSSNGKDSSAELVQRLLEKEDTIASLQHENKVLSEEKYDLMKKLDSTRSRDQMQDDDQLCLKTLCRRTQRERDLLRSDVERLEEECNALKQKISALTDTQVSQQDRLRKSLVEAEDQVRNLEQERREILQDQTTRRSTIDTLEDQNSSLKEQLRVCQGDLNKQRANYSQLKALHEQTDRSLTDVQCKLVQAETELASVLENLQSKEVEKGTVSKEVVSLRNDVDVMRARLAQIDREKDELLVALDDKTEKMVQLQSQVKSKERTIESLEEMVNDLKKKIGATLDQHNTQDQLLRTTQEELIAARQELDKTKKLNESAAYENRRLHDDLAAVTSDCRNSRKELDLYKRQVDDLKTQLQQYVAEVKRAEDLISNKEIERSELLDQFRSLSQEANILENSNHTLEHEATQTKVQLSVALDYTQGLERKLENKDGVIQSYERQIGDLSSQVASLEMQLKQCVEQYDQTNIDLQKMRDLCSNLDSDNANIKRQLREKQDQKIMTDRNVEQLRNDRENLQRTVSREKRSTETIEREREEAKRETTELRLLNQELQDEIQRLKIQVQELKERLTVASEQVDLFQEKALEYSQQNKQLRRQVANDRFRRSSETNKYPHHCVCVPRNPPNTPANKANNVTNFGSPVPSPQDLSLLENVWEATMDPNNATVPEEGLKRCTLQKCFYRSGGKFKCEKCGRLKKEAENGNNNNNLNLQDSFCNGDKDKKSQRHWRFSRTGSTMTEQMNKNSKIGDSCVVKSCVTVDNAGETKNVVNYTFVHELQRGQKGKKDANV